MGQRVRPDRTNVLRAPKTLQALYEYHSMNDAEPTYRMPILTLLPIFCAQLTSVLPVSLFIARAPVPLLQPQPGPHHHHRRYRAPFALGVKGLDAVNRAGQVILW